MRRAVPEAFRAPTPSRDEVQTRGRLAPPKAVTGRGQMHDHQETVEGSSCSFGNKALPGWVRGPRLELDAMAGYSKATQQSIAKSELIRVGKKPRSYFGRAQSPVT